MSPARLPAALALALVAALAAAPLRAQSSPTPPAPSSGKPDRLKEVVDGDGRIHGAPVLPVSEADLHPGQVQTVNLHPRYHAILEFPFPIARVDAGDPDVFLASIVGNKLTLKATKVSKSETSMSVILADADLTVIPFLVRADSTQPYAYVVRYTDPVSKHLNQAEAAIADRMRADVDGRVDDLAELRLQQRLMVAGGVVRINKEATVGRRGERLTIKIESAQELPGNDGTPRLYIRYRAENGTVAPLADLHFVLRVEKVRHRLFLFSKRSARELYDVQDVRGAVSVPPGSAVTGLLVLDMLDLKADESLSVEALGFNEQRRVRVDRVLVGQPK